MGFLANPNSTCVANSAIDGNYHRKRFCPNTQYNSKLFREIASVIMQIFWGPPPAPATLRGTIPQTDSKYATQC